MIIGRILEEAGPYLDNVKIEDAVVGLSLIGIELDNRNIGVTYVLREGLRAGCSVFPYAQKMIGHEASEIAQWSRTGGDPHGIVMPMEQQANMLPKCDIVVMSGTTIMNGTFDSLLAMCGNARDIIVIGSSCPMYPRAFTGTNVTVLAGSWWDSDRKTDIFKIISLAGGIRHLADFSIKKTVRVSD